MRVLIPIIVSYLLGSIPFGYLIVTAKTGSDIRQTGSGGTGATNVSRRAGKTAGILTLVLDALKGAAAVVIAKFLIADVSNAMWWTGLAGIVAMLGHIFPVWLAFRGGKGVATGVGVFLVLAPVAVLLSAILFVMIVWTTRYVSLGSMIAALSVALFAWLLNATTPIVVSTLLSAFLIVYAHRANISRLLKHTENKFR
ncbi:MAG TPA: glycerol-3-phosphate 1-O-acyltransferase PlsY [Pyrinomonadaceae bacterium]|nr:glycerol-3-phosphate 1-O-acyltransferase PlsY [Pyrinomonadaceae bacterium]